MRKVEADAKAEPKAWHVRSRIYPFSGGMKS